MQLEAIEQEGASLIEDKHLQIRRLRLD